MRVWISAEVCLSGCGAAAWGVSQPLSLPAGSCVGRFVIDHRNSGKDCHLFAHETHNRNSGRDSLHLVCRSEEIGSWKMIWGPRRLDVSFSLEERRIPRDFWPMSISGLTNVTTTRGAGTGRWDRWVSEIRWETWKTKNFDGRRIRKEGIDLVCRTLSFTHSSLLPRTRWVGAAGLIER